MDKKKKTILFATLFSVVGAAVLSGGIYYTWLITPPSPPKTAEDAVSTIGSARFNRLPESRKAEYMEQTRTLVDKLPEDQRHKLFEKMHESPEARESMHQAMEATMMKRAEDFAKADPQERIRILDEMIDRMETRRKEREANGQADNRGPGNGQPGGFGRGHGGPGGRGGNRANRIKRSAQEGNPQAAGLRREFHKAMQQRMEQRGITPPNRR
jgi:hypothetical protein